jgi:hypothetical protein
MSVSKEVLISTALQNCSETSSMKIIIQSFAAITFTLIGFARLPKAEAVTPPPDGCYPNYTTAEGCSALNFLTTGAGNTAVGWYALYVDTDGSFNTGVGSGALALNIGSSNTAVGAAALLLNTNGTENTALGTNALLNNLAGGQNTANGAFALFHNFAFGNTAIGADALFANMYGESSTAVGALALANSIDASYNTAVGWAALYSHQIGNFNNAFGDDALISDETGGSNNAFGTNALASNVSGVGNSAMGDMALSGSVGDYNIALGFAAGSDPFIGSNNIYIGDSGFENDENVIAIGRIAPSGTPYENTYIGGIYDTVVTDRIVYVASDGHLGTLASSRRYKEEIKPMNNASEALFGLKPVTFRYKQKIDPAHKLSFGLIAEEVAQISSDLVSRDKEGRPQTVRYEAVNVMLLNEFLKEHRRVAELKSTMAQQRRDFETVIAQQQKTMEALATRLNKQEAEIQKVSAQLEATSAARQMLVENH